MVEAGTFNAALLVQERIAYHEGAISALQDHIAEMKRGDIRHYSEGRDGRLNVDSTKEMIEIAEASLRTHTQTIGLLRLRDARRLSPSLA